MNYYDLTVHELHDLLIKKEVTSEEITQNIIKRTEDVDPKVKAYITKTQDLALDQAKKVDEIISKGEVIGALEGIPMAFKDNMCTDGINTTCASKMLEDFVPFYDGHVVKKVKEANSPVLGKLNMDEFAMGSSTETSCFFKTRNPYDLERVPGGSSGGSAAAVSSGMAVYSLGSDTGGSIRQPAAHCGVVGMKPTYGLVSRYGCVAYASSFDQVGPITKDVTDCASVLNVIAGYDSMDSTSLNIPKVDYTKALVNDVKGMKIGLPVDYIQNAVSDDVRKVFLEAVDVFKSLGATVEEFELKAAKYALPAYYIISNAEASSNLARFDGIRYGYRTQNYTNLKELYENTRGEGFGDEVKKRIMMGSYALSSKHYEDYYIKAQKVRTIIVNDFNEQFKKYDFLISPTTTSTAFKFGEKSEDPASMFLNDFCTVSASIAGLPAISLPCGTGANDMPVGLHIIGKALDESTVLQGAYSFEQSTDFHKNRALIK